MPKAPLTKKFIDGLEFAPAGKPLFYWDTKLNGLGLKVTSQKKIFLAQAYVKNLGKRRRVTLGSYGALTLKQAEEAAKKTLGEMAIGGDPSAERKKKKAENVTLDQVVGSYLKSKTLKPLSIKDIKTHRDFNFKAWKNKPLSQINREDVKKKFMEITKRSPAQANQAFRNFRAWWNYAIAEYRYPNDTPVFGENPVNILSEQKIWNQVKPRDGKIPVNKVGIAWNTLKDLNRSPVQSPASRTMVDAAIFILLTGGRLDEATALTWGRVNTEEGWWHLDDPKNHRAVTFPLSKVACEIIESRPRVNEYVFGSKGKYGHITEIRTPMKKISEAIGVKVTAHDLRRTFKAMAIENQIELWKANLLTNHQESGVAIKHYVETSDLQYFRQEVNIIADWVEEQAGIAKTDNVISMVERQRA